MLMYIGDIIIIGMLLLLLVVSGLLAHQIKMIIIEDREFRAWMKELRNEP